MDKLSMSLDDIIKQDKRKLGDPGKRSTGAVRRGFPNRNFQNRSSGIPVKPRTGIRNNSNRYSPYNRGNVDTRWTHDLYEGGESYYGANSAEQGHVTKMIVSNLDYAVSDFDLVELFTEFGSLISADINYDKSGRSIGTGNVYFKNKASAIRAMNFYNAVPLDGRPMTIQLVENARLTQPAISRFVPRGRPRTFGRSTNRGRSDNNWNRNRSNRNGNVTAEQLDAELDSYVKAA